MLSSPLTYVNEQICHFEAIETLNDQAFGPGRHARAAARVREQGPSDLDLSFVCLKGEKLVGSVKMTPIHIGAHPSYLLGPLAVNPAFKNQGIGRKLVMQATNAARKTIAQSVLLVGDAPYYGQLGYERVQNIVKMPGPVDQTRLLVHCFEPENLPQIDGVVRYRPIN